MKKLLFTFGMVFMSFLFTIELNAQATATSNQDLTMGIPEVCLLGTDGVAVSLQLTTTTAGAQIAGGTGTSYAQVSSIVSAAETRTITATITGVPTGTSLTVDTAIPSNGNQGGTLGTGTTGINLINSDPAVTLVTGIGSCFTGTASTDGYVLSYAWDAGASGSYGNIVATAGATATVVLTITNL